MITPLVFIHHKTINFAYIQFIRFFLRVGHELSISLSSYSTCQATGDSIMSGGMCYNAFVAAKGSTASSTPAMLANSVEVQRMARHLAANGDELEREVQKALAKLKATYTVAERSRDHQHESQAPNQSTLDELRQVAPVIAPREMLHLQALDERFNHSLAPPSHVLENVRQLSRMNANDTLPACSLCSSRFVATPIFSCTVHCADFTGHHFCGSCEKSIGKTCPLCSRGVTHQRDLLYEVAVLSSR